MNSLGHVESLWRYPVKSMRGEELSQAFLGYAGVYGDRVFCFTTSAGPKAFPYFTGRESAQLLRYQPVFRDGPLAALPPNLQDIEALAPGITPIYPEAAAMTVDVQSPEGETFPIDDPRLLADLLTGAHARHRLELVYSNRAMTDCSPVSLLSVQTAGGLGSELGMSIDKRRFRANIYLNLTSGDPFGEDKLVGRTVQIGDRAVLRVLKRDSRCKMITLDPDTAEMNPTIMRQVASAHEGQVGIYAAVLTEGIVHSGDPLSLLD